MNFFENANLTKRFLGLALRGAEWVLWLLVALSVISIAIIFYKGIYFLLLNAPVDSFLAKLRQFLRIGDLEGARKLAKSTPGVEAKMVLAGLRENNIAAMEDAMLAEKIRMRVQLEKNLSFLGTLGSNAPFIGLFGTVLGVIQAFNELKKPVENKAGDVMGGVMTGISEALVATAVGLLVAIPAVVAYNFYNRVVRRKAAQMDATLQNVLGMLKDTKEPFSGSIPEAVGGK